jgi:hypothetical protein
VPRWRPTSAARSATLRPCLTVVLAARTLAAAASRVSVAAMVRLRRPVAFEGDLAAVERELVEREAVEREPVEREAARVLLPLLRAVLFERELLDVRALLVRLAGVALVLLVVLSAMWWISPSVRSLYRT